MAWEKFISSPFSYLLSHTCSRVEGWHSVRVCRLLGDTDSCHLYLQNRRKNGRKGVAGASSYWFIGLAFAVKWLESCSVVNTTEALACYLLLHDGNQAQNYQTEIDSRKSTVMMYLIFGATYILIFINLSHTKITVKYCKWIFLTWILY